MAWSAPFKEAAMQNITQVLKNNFEERRRKNRRFSLRAYAKFLEIDAPTLSKIFSHQKKPGIRLTKRLADKLGLDPKKQRSLMGGAGGRNPQDRDFRYVESDQFQAMSRWYYNALLEILELKNFSDDPVWIASKLNLSVNEVKIALERLERLGQIQKTDKGWKDLTGGVTTVLGRDLTSSARRSHQKELLEIAMQALEDVPVEYRDQTSMTMAIGVDDIPKVKELIKDFRRRLFSFLNDNPEKTEVYNLSVSFFPLSKLNQKEKNA